MTQNNPLASKLREALELIDNGLPEQGHYPMIGVAITEHNRYDVFQRCYQEVKRFLPQGAKLVVVDDASTKPVSEATYRFDRQAGVAKAKNKCIELLYRMGCDHFFLFDSDCWPTSSDWWKPYVESPEHHLMYQFEDVKGPHKIGDSILLYKDDKHKAYSHSRGCMLYMSRTCIDRIGGMDTSFGLYGWEHPSYSCRAYNAGLTSFRYGDVIGSEELIHSLDEEGKVISSIHHNARMESVRANMPKFEASRHSSEFIQFMEPRNILITTLFTAVKDPQRHENMKGDTSVLSGLIESLKGQELVVLQDFIESKTEGSVKYERVSTSLNPYFQRWVSIRDYLRGNPDVDKVFCVDGTDVEMLRNPFGEMDNGKLYLGDENQHVACQWITANHKAPLLTEFYSKYGSRQLLNAGLVGGDRDTVLQFIHDLLDVYFQLRVDNHYKKTPDAGLTDMALLNYVAYTKFCDRLLHGGQVNTRFKAEEKNGYSWFRHK